MEKYGELVHTESRLATKEHQIFRALDNVAHDITGNAWKSRAIVFFFAWREEEDPDCKFSPMHPGCISPKAWKSRALRNNFFDFLFPEGRDLSYFPPTFPCFFLGITWMQCGKLTIKVFLFPSIQKNISLSPCAACNIVKNIIQEYSTWCSLILFLFFFWLMIYVSPPKYIRIPPRICSRMTNRS